jgi:energy-coupling factor transporter ATP-binding protein EcfA2
MSRDSKGKASWPPKLLFRDHRSPNQGELRVITNAIHAALEYSPLGAAPEYHRDVYAKVARCVEERFWTDIYVDRPEIREIIFTLDTGLLTLITGERGTGKSTAIKAVIQELTGSTELETGIEPRSRTPNLIPYVFDANQFTEDMTDEQEVSDTIHEHMFTFLDGQIRDRSAWLSYLYEHSQAFYELQLALDKANVAPQTPVEWSYFAEQERYAGLADAGITKFAQTKFSDRLRVLLAFLGERTTYEPLLVIDNVDHLDNGLVLKCGLVLGAIRQSSGHRVRAAMALRPETAEAIQSRLDTLPQPHPISMMQRAVSAGDDERSSIRVTVEFLEKRLAVLRDPEVVAMMREAIDPKKASKLAAEFNERSVSGFLNHLMELLDLMIFDVFRSDEQDDDLKKENFEFARAVHAWHNGSLRECALSLTTFAAEILQNKDHMARLRSLLQYTEVSSNEDPAIRRSRLRRISRSLLYRHLLLWAAPEADQPRPLKNVMVFDGDEELTTPPIHFLRLRILQYLAHQPKGRAKVEAIREDLGQLGLKERRIDETLRELAVKRTQDDAGLIRIDGSSRGDLSAKLDGSASVQLLDAGRFLAERLYITAEYLFWSALYTKAASQSAKIPSKVNSDELQSDAFRATVATRFLEKYLVKKFTDEHPYLLGLDEEWTAERARERLKIYERLFGFSPEDWFLNKAARSVNRFIPKRDPEGEWRGAKESIDRIQELAASLDAVRKAAGGQR